MIISFMFLNMIRLRKLGTAIFLAGVTVVAVGTSLIWGISAAGCGFISGSASTEQSAQDSFFRSNQGLIWLSPTAAPSTSIKTATRGVATDSVLSASVREGMVLKNKAGAHCFIASNNIIVRFGDNQACHYLDIPPPATL